MAATIGPRIMLRTSLVLAAVTALTLGAAACTAASGDARGGELRFDASAPLTVGEGGISLCRASADGGSVGGATWTSLYADYFGGSAPSGCGKSSGCHSAADQQGAVASNYVCPPSDKDACYAGITSSNAGLIDSQNPEGSGLFLVLRKTTAVGTNKMPRSPACAFSDDDMRRITDWMKAGAKND